MIHSRHASMNHFDYKKYHKYLQLSRCLVEDISLFLLQVMETMPDTEEMADFSLILKSFYETVYEPTGEEPPYMLRIFKKPLTENGKSEIDKQNGQSGKTVTEKEKDITEKLESTDIHLNGFYSNGDDAHTSDNEIGLPFNSETEQEDNEIVVVKTIKQNNHISSNAHDTQDVHLSNDLEVKQTAAENLFIVEVVSQKKGKGSKWSSDEKGLHILSIS